MTDRARKVLLIGASGGLGLALADLWLGNGWHVTATVMTAGRTHSQLAEVNGYDPSYATVIVDKLESYGLVNRREHPDDRRRKLVELTASGHAAMNSADAIRQRPPLAFDALTTQEVDQLADLLSQLPGLRKPE